MLIKYYFRKRNPMEKKVHLNTLLLMMTMIIFIHIYIDNASNIYNASTNDWIC